MSLGRRPRPRHAPGPSLLVIGAGPIGIETALYARHAGYDARVIEAGRVGEQMLAWGHVPMLSSWEINCSSLGLRTLARDGIRPFQRGSSPPTGRAYVDRYLRPLARTAPLRGRISEETRALAIGREGLLKGDRVGLPDRGSSPFRVLVTRGGRERIERADIVIDATGTYGRHRYLGSGGIPAPGEIQAASRIDYRLVDFTGRRRRDFAGRRVLLVGAGHSAATSALGLAAIVRSDPPTRIVWAVRGTRSPLYVRFADDPLPARDRLAAEANAIAGGAVAGFELVPGSWIEAIQSARPGAKGERPPLVVTLRSGARLRRLQIDRIVANVGYAPDRSLYAELQVHECYASEGPMRLAAVLLARTGGAGDCLSGPGPSADLLGNPEPGFFILGSKSYGRNSAFLIGAGRDQIRTLFRTLSGDPALDLYAKSPVPLPRRAAPGRSTTATLGGEANR